MKKIKKSLRALKRFLFKNRDKKLTIKVWYLSMFYRFCILTLPKTKLEKMMGVRGEESKAEETVQNLRIAYKIGADVHRVTRHTPWESKCLVRSMTCRKLLEEKGIGSTLFLGVGKDENGKMIAHSWLRCGDMWVTGGNGEGYAMVAKFATYGEK